MHGVFQLSCNELDASEGAIGFGSRGFVDGNAYRNGKGGARTKPTVCWLLDLFLLDPEVGVEERVACCLWCENKAGGARQNQ